jgi:hypothetical protein
MAEVHSSHGGVDEVREVFVQGGRTPSGMGLPFDAEGHTPAVRAPLETFPEDPSEDPDHHGHGRRRQKDDYQDGRDHFCGNSHVPSPSVEYQGAY